VRVNDDDEEETIYSQSEVIRVRNDSRSGTIMNAVSDNESEFMRVEGDDMSDATYINR
jgi:hypothetical protein